MSAPRLLTRSFLALGVLCALASAARSQTHWPPGNRPEALIDDFYRPGDLGDWAPAFRRAIDSFPVGAQYPVAGKILFGARVYRFASTLDIDRSVVLQGMGNPGWFGATVLEFDADVSGMIVHFLGTSPNDSRGRGSWSILRDLVVRSAGTLGGVADGITLWDRATLENVYVTGFSGIGVRIDADVNRTPPTNANTWRIENVTIDGCGSHGLYLDGGDTNAGVANALTSSSNGGWGVYDSSFLGNTFVGVATATNGLGSFKVDSRNARTLLLNCYAESDQNPAEVIAPSVVLGGIVPVADGFDALWMSAEGFMATFPNGVQSVNDLGSVAVTGRLGSPNVGNVAYELAQSGEPSWPWRMEFDDSDQWWKMRWANVNQVAYALSVSATAEGPGQFWMPNGFWLGPVAGRSHQQSVTRGSLTGVQTTIDGAAHFTAWADSPPSSGTFAPGDVVWNTSTSAEAGWRYDGTTWRAF